jgi:hypothetical protein
VATITLTKYAGQLNTQITALRRSQRALGGATSYGEDTGLQRIGYLKDNAGNVFTCYWDPNTTTIFYDDGSPVLSQE